MKLQQDKLELSKKYFVRKVNGFTQIKSSFGRGIGMRMVVD